MYILTVIRTMTRVCIPLFLMITGYLMCYKELSRKYYYGIIRTLVIYIMAGSICIAYAKVWAGEDISIFRAVANILNFSASDYSWYIEMYIGLFMIIPFLNILYGSLFTRKRKMALILTFLFLTALPSVVNIYNWGMAGWWKQPTITNDYDKLIPAWWQSCYPMTYYFMGCYLRENKVSIDRRKNLCAILVVLILSGSFNYYRSYGNTFIWGDWQEHFSILNAVLAMLIFILFENFDLDRCPALIQRGLAVLAGCCLGAYLVSTVVENVIYPRLKSLELTGTGAVFGSILAIGAVLAISLIISLCISLVYDRGKGAVMKIVKKV